MKNLLWFYFVTAMVSVFAAPAIGKNCASSLESGYVFATWALSDSRTTEGKQIDTEIEKLCKEVDCPIFCSNETSKVPKDILIAQASCRNKEKAACAKFWDYVGLKTEPNAQQSCFYLGGKACDLCYYVGGQFCNSGLRFGEPIHSAGTALQHKIACHGGVAEACAEIQKFHDSRSKESQQKCDATLDSSACAKTVDSLSGSGKSSEAVNKAIDLCKKGTHETCLGFYESPDRGKLSDQQKSFNADYVAAIDRECKTSKLLQACYTWADINKRSNPLPAAELFRMVCMASPVTMNDMYHNACFATLDRSLEAKNWADADVAKSHLCRFYKQKFGDSNKSCSDAEQKIKIAKGGTDLLSVNASCKTDGRKTFYDKDGHSTLTLSCKGGLLEGDSVFHSEWSDPANWFYNPVTIHYVKGVATGRVIGADHNENLTEFLFKDGRVVGRFKRIQTKTAGGVYPYIDGELIDGVYNGEVKTDDKKTTFYDYGLLKWRLDRKGSKVPYSEKCPDVAVGPSIEWYVEKYIKESSCAWTDKKDRINDPVKGFVSRMRMPLKNRNFEILTLNNGIVTEARECNQKSQLSRVKMYGYSIGEKGVINYADIPYVKILDVEFRNGKQHGLAQFFVDGKFRESVSYENGVVNEKTRRFGMSPVNCPGIHKAN